MNNTSRFCLVALLFAGFLLSACVPRAPLPPGRTVLPAAVASELYDQLLKTGSQTRSLEGIARVHARWQGKNATVTQALLVEKPDRFRAETLNPFGFGSPLLLMATDGEEMAVMIPGEGLMFRGEASARNLQRFTRLPLQPADLVHLLLYQVPVIAHQSLAASLGADGDRLLQLLGPDGRRQEVRFDANSLLVESAYFVDGELALRVNYSNFSTSAAFPRSFYMEMPQQQAEASLTFSELATDVQVEAKSFHLSTPEGYLERPIP